MYSGTLEISSNIVEATLKYQGTTVGGDINISSNNFTGVLSHQITSVVDPSLELRVLALEEENTVLTSKIDW